MVRVCSGWKGWEIRRVLANPAVRYALGLFLVLRVGLTLVAALAGALLPAPGGDPALTMPGLRGPLLEVWFRFDALRYLQVASEGYSTDPANLVFPPLYPLLIRIASPVLAGDAALTALVISNVALILGLIALYRWVNLRAGASTARRTLLYFLAFPASFFLFGAYTESLFLLLAVTSLIAAEAGSWGRAGVLGMLAALTRKEGGVALTLALLYLYLEKRQFQWRDMGRDLIWLGLVPLGYLAYLLLPALVLDRPTGWDELTALWGLRLAPPWEQLAAGVQAALRWPIPLVPALDLLSTLGVSVLAVAAWRRSRALALYMAALLASYLVWFPPQMPLVSMTRHVLMFFPGFWLLAERLESAGARRLVLVPSTILLIYLTALFALGEWVG